MLETMAHLPRNLLLVVAAASLSAAARDARAAENPRVGVLAVGPHTASTGRLQRAIDTALSTQPGIVHVPAAELAAKIAFAEIRVAADTAPLRKQAADLVAQASRAYDEDQIPVALERLKSAAAIYDKVDEAWMADRLRLHLLRATVQIGSGDSAGAEASVRELLALDAKHVVDLNLYPPPVAALVERVRAKLLPVTITLQGAPPGAEVRVDDKVTSASVSLPAGRHYVSVTATGFRPLIRAINVQADTTVDLSSPIALKRDDVRALTALSAGPPKEKSDGAKDPLAELAAAAELDVMIVLAARASFPTEVRAMVWKKSKPSEPSRIPKPLSVPDPESNPRGLTPLLTWISDELEALRKSLEEKEARTSAAAWGSDGGSIGVVTRGGLAVALWGRSFTEGDADAVVAKMTGAGPRVEAAVSWKGLVLALDAALYSYAITTVEAQLPEGESDTKQGGTMNRISTAVGYRKAVADSVSLGGFVGYQIEGYKAIPLEKEYGDRPLFTDTSMSGIAVRAEGSYWLGAARLAITGGAGVLLPQWKETPADISGTDQTASIAPTWRLGLDWAPRDRWRMGLDLGGELRTVSLESAEGDKNSLSETMTTVSANVSFAF